MYDRLAAGWWDSDSFLYTLRSALNPARFPYLRRTMTGTLGIDPKDIAVLDVGCGGGLLAEEFAALGCRVTGVDPSSESLAVARAHAAQGGLAIEYIEGTGEALPFEDASFDVVYCCDVLEHVNDVGKTIVEIARVLKPGGRLVVGELFGDPHMVTSGALRERAERAGLTFERQLGGPLAYFARFRK